MKKHFYSHLIEIDSLYIGLDLLDLNNEERKELTHLLDSNIHHVVLDTVLSELSEEDKRLFLTHVASDKHDDIWDLLNKKVQNIEEKIRKAAEDLKKELHEDIKEAKK